MPTALAVVVVVVVVAAAAAAAAVGPVADSEPEFVAAEGNSCSELVGELCNLREGTAIVEC